MKSRSNEWRTLALRFSILLALVTTIVSKNASATLYDVTFEADVRATDFYGSGSVFGIAPSDFLFSTTFRIDDAAAPVSAIGAGTQTSLNPLAYDIWGYDMSAISGTSGVGTKIWDSSALVRLTFRGDVPDSYSWFDMPLSDGATSNQSWVRFQDGDGFLMLGSGVADGFGRDLHVYDNLTASRFIAPNFRISASVAPEPGTAILFGLGLAGLASARPSAKRRSRAQKIA